MRLMNLRLSQTILLVFALGGIGCQGATHKEVALPSDVFTLNNELYSIRTASNLTDSDIVVTLGVPKADGKSILSVDYYEYRNGGLVHRGTSKPEIADGQVKVRISAEANTQYVIQPVDPRLVNAYDLLCYLRERNRARRSTRVPRICLSILCADAPLGVDEARSQFNRELGDWRGDPRGGDMVGGFGGSYCDQCIDVLTDWEIDIPHADCGEGGNTPTDPEDCAGTVVYSTREIAFSNPGSEIHTLDLQTGAVVNLSGGADLNDTAHDVSEDGRKILFTSGGRSGGPGVYVMEADGSAASREMLVPSDVARLRWFRQGFRTFAFNVPSDNSEIFIFDRDNLLWSPNPKQITFPSSTETDFGGFDIFPMSKDIIFSRSQLSTNRSDLFRRDIFDHNASAVNVTNTPNLNESFPVFSHNEQLLAFRVSNHENDDESIRLMDVSPTNVLTDHSIIDLDASLYFRIGRIEFTPDDKCLIVTCEVKAVDTQIPRNRNEILVIDIATQSITRKTTNLVAEHNAVAIPNP